MDLFGSQREEEIEEAQCGREDGPRQEVTGFLSPLEVNGIEGLPCISL